MDKKKALEIIEEMIKAEKGQPSDLDSTLRALRDQIVTIHNSGIHPLAKAISEVQEVLKKSSGFNLDMAEKAEGAPAPVSVPKMPKMGGPKTPKMPGGAQPAPMKAPGMAKAAVKKVDPKTHLRGTLLDKNLSTADVQAGPMGSSGMNLTPGMQSGPGMAKASPADAPPMAASEKHKEIAKRLKKCMKKTLTASEDLDKGKALDFKTGQVISDTGEEPLISRPSNADLKLVPKVDKKPAAKKPAAKKPAFKHPPKPKKLKQSEHIAKDDKPHKPGTGEHSAHEIVEHGHSIKEEISALHNNKQQVHKMFEHLRNRKQSKNWERSPENVIDKAEATKAFEGHEGTKDISKEAQRAILEPKDQPMKIQPHRPGQANKPVEKAEDLKKPYASQAQRRKFHAMENRGEISHATVAEWDKESKGKKLPERKK
jgi:hypothetical protein